MLEDEERTYQILGDMEGSADEGTTCYFLFLPHFHSIFRPLLRPTLISQHGCTQPSGFPWYLL